jgi:ADP-ribose pyrophosphatase YjhB (NUDIX family)
VGAVVRRGGDVLLVPEDETWALPGGVVEPNESVAAALDRKVTEETGLSDVQVGPLLWVARYEVGGEAWQTYGFEVRSEEDDPGWVPVADAIERLSAMWFPPLRAPAVRYLEGRTAVATLWTWTRLDQEPEVLPALR